MKSEMRLVREDLRLTQADLAKKAKISLRTIHHVENGGASRPSTKIRILRALGLSFADRDRLFKDNDKTAVELRRAARAS